MRTTMIGNKIGKCALGVPSKELVTTIYDNEEVLFVKVEGFIDGFEKFNTVTYKTNYCDSFYDEYTYDAEGNMKCYSRRDKEKGWIYAEEQYMQDWDRDGEYYLRAVSPIHGITYEFIKDRWYLDLGAFNRSELTKEQGDLILAPLLKKKPIEVFERQLEVYKGFIKSN